MVSRCPPVSPQRQEREDSVKLLAPIIAVTWSLQRTRTRSRSCKWIAEAYVDGEVFAVASRNGVPNALARRLTEAGLRDRPMEVHDRAGRLMIRYRSFHDAARWTYTEGDHRLRRAPYKAFPIVSAPGVQADDESGAEAVDDAVDLAPSRNEVKATLPTQIRRFQLEYFGGDRERMNQPLQTRRLP